MSLELDSVAVRYGDRPALEPTTLSLAGARHFGLIGPNGAGKSSLLKAVAGVLEYTGNVAWSGQAVADMTPDVRARMIAYLSQSPAAHWPMRVRELVALGRLPHRRFAAPLSDDDEAAITSALHTTDTVELQDRRMNELSGGEFARVQLARALCVQAPVLLVDEPTTLLDPYHQLQIMAVLRRYAEKGALVISVLHDLTLAARFCDRVLLMNDARIVSEGAPREVMTADTLRRVYGIAPLVSSHAGEPLILPWTTDVSA